MDAETVKRWLNEAAAAVREQRDYLTQLDAAIGDADHGTNMDRGFTAVVEKLQGLEAPPGRLLVTAGGTLVSTVGGASGASTPSTAPTPHPISSSLVPGESVVPPRISSSRQCLACANSRSCSALA